MGQVYVDENSLSSIGNAIRNITNTNNYYYPNQMGPAIENISSVWKLVDGISFAKSNFTDIPDDIKHNYYYPENYYDYIKERNISNFMNINRLRPDIKFLKLDHIGINIDVQKVREYEL